VSKLLINGLIEARAYPQLETFAAGIVFARTEGFIPAPETTHAIACAIEEAKMAKEEGKEKTILMNWSGHGIIDLPSYDAFLSGMLGDYALPDEEIARLVKDLEKYPKPRQ